MMKCWWKGAGGIMCASQCTCLLALPSLLHSWRLAAGSIVTSVSPSWLQLLFSVNRKTFYSHLSSPQGGLLWWLLNYLLKKPSRHWGGGGHCDWRLITAKTINSIKLIFDKLHNKDTRRINNAKPVNDSWWFDTLIDAGCVINSCCSLSTNDQVIMSLCVCFTLNGPSVNK